MTVEPFVYFIVMSTSLVKGEMYDLANCNDDGENCTTEICKKCGCNSTVVLYYNETSNECIVDWKRLLESLVQKYNFQEKIQREAERVFMGIWISALVFAFSAALYAICGCIYCCRIVYIDRKLERDVQALAQKIGRNKIKKVAAKVKTEPIAESCNVMVEDAGIFVV